MTVEKEEKPKKLFTVKFDVYDDGQVDPDLIEYVQGPVGRPKAWRMEPKEFVLSIKRQLSETPALFFGHLMGHMGMTNDDVKRLQIPDHKLGEAPEVNEADFDFDEE